MFELSREKTQAMRDAVLEIRIACSQILILFAQVLRIAKFLNHHRPASVHPHLGKNPPQRLAAAEPHADEMEKRKRLLDRVDFERLTRTS